MINSLVLSSATFLSASQVIQKEPGITKFITEILGFIINIIYNVVSSFTLANSLGISIILLTIIVRVLMLPLAMKQQKSMVKMQLIQPEVTKIQKKYGDNKDPEVQKKMQAEIQAIYSKNGVNPLAGCLPLLIQLPIFVSLSYLMNNAYLFIGKLGDIYRTIGERIVEIPGIDTILVNIAAPKMQKGVTLNLGQSMEDVLKVVNRFNQDDWASVMGAASSDTVSAINEQLAQLSIIENFMGIDLTAAAGTSWPGVLIPIFAVITTMLSSYIAQKTTTNTNMTDQAKQTQRMMLIVMPLVMGFTTIGLSAGVGLYWITSSVFQTAQQVVVNKHVREQTSNNTDVIESK